MAPENPLIQRYLAAAVAEGLYRNPRNLGFYLKNLFSGISLQGRTALEIGGGSGLVSFYMRCAGAAEVICLEPEAAGSTSGATGMFKRLSDRLNIDQVSLENTTFQEYEPEGQVYDIIVLHNSINHLDEDACVALRRDPEAKQRYRSIFEKLGRPSGTGAKLVITDCGRLNAFAMLKIRNPIVSSIEWHKHQEPAYWAELLTEVGFENPRIRWPSFNTLRTAGDILLGNRVASFFLTSHFILTMTKRGKPFP